MQVLRHLWIQRIVDVNQFSSMFESKVLSATVRTVYLNSWKSKQSTYGHRAPFSWNGRLWSTQHEPSDSHKRTHKNQETLTDSLPLHLCLWPQIWLYTFYKLVRDWERSSCTLPLMPFTQMSGTPLVQSFAFSSISTDSKTDNALSTSAFVIPS